MKLKFLLSFQLICHLRILASQSIYFSILFKYFSLFKFFFHSSILSPFLFSYLSSPLILFYNNHSQINSHIKIHGSQFTFKPPYPVKTIKPPEAKIILGCWSIKAQTVIVVSSAHCRGYSQTSTEHMICP